MGKILIAKDAAAKALAAELSRAESLVRSAWKFAAGILLVLGFQLRDVRTLVESPSLWVKILCGASLGILGVALVLAVRCLQAKDHGNYPRGNKLWENLKPENISEEAAQEALLQMLLQTREQNARGNDATSRMLNWCGWMFLGGVLLAVACQLLDAFESWT